KIRLGKAGSTEASEPETFIADARPRNNYPFVRLFVPQCLYGGTTNAFPYALASDLLSGSGSAVRRVLPACTRADRARRGAGLGLFLVHRAPLPALRRSHAQPGRDHVCGRGAHLADSPGLRDLDFALAPSGGGRRELRHGGRAIRRAAG